MAMSYREALDALERRGRFGIRLGLGRTRAMLRALGDPQESLRGVLVGGTNGKGSVVALAGAALAAAGHRVGRTPKPHLVSYRERLAIGDRLIDPAAFAALVAEVLLVAERVARRLGDPTEFEVLTAVAFLWFARERVDLALVEVGLGGRLDATNVWDGGVAAITNVDWDHRDHLGDTLEAIAHEKAAIIKGSDLAITAASGPGLAVIRRRARRVGAELDEVVVPAVVAAGVNGLLLAADGLPPASGRRVASRAPLRVALRGRHQAANAAVALGVLRALARSGIAEVGEAAIRDGFAAATWPGRLERLDGAGVGMPGREIWLDGAHNAAGAAALAAALDELRPSMAPGRLVLILGMMGDKDVDAVLAPLAASPATRGAHIITTRVEATRALPADRLAERWRAIALRVGRAGAAVTVSPTPDAALGAALAHAQGPIVVAGSLYLVGAVRARLVDDPQLRDPEE